MEVRLLVCGSALGHELSNFEAPKHPGSGFYRDPLLTLSPYKDVCLLSLHSPYTLLSLLGILFQDFSLVHT